MKKRIMCAVGAVLIVSMLGGCNSNTVNEATGTTEQTTGEVNDSANEGNSGSAQATFEDYKIKSLPQLEEIKEGDTIAVINTSAGVVKVRLFPEYAPKAVENFTTHAKEGYYDGVIFHRVINEFMIQSGDPEGTGRGGESIWGQPFENEVSYNLRNFRGALCMANAGGNATNGSQFYIVQNTGLDESTKSQLEELKDKQDEVYYEDKDMGTLLYSDIFPIPVLDEYINNGGFPTGDMSYTVFGQVYEGMDVVDSIAGVETDENDKPLEDIVVESIEVGTYGE